MDKLHNFQKFILSESTVSAYRLKDFDIECKSMEELHDCVHGVLEGAEVGQIIHYLSDKGRAAFKKLQRESEDRDCDQFYSLIDKVATVNKESKFCSNLPKKWLTECRGRQQMVEPAIKYSLASEKDCKEKNFLWNEWTGCSSECSQNGMSIFKDGEDRCAFIEPASAVVEVITDPEPVAVIDEDKEEALVTAVTPAKADACQDAKIVGKAVGHF